MAVSAELSTVNAIAGMPGRSRSKRPTISAAKCWLSAAEPPLPQARTLRPPFNASASAAPARAISAGRISAMRCLSSMPSSKCLRRCAAMSIAKFYLSGGIERPAQPERLVTTETDDVEAARRQMREAQEVLPRGGDDAALLARRDALDGAAEAL